MVKLKYQAVICATVIVFLLFGIINSNDGAKAQRPSEEQQVQEDKEKIMMIRTITEINGICH
jgi:hypothetical protein